MAGRRNIPFWVFSLHEAVSKFSPLILYFFKEITICNYFNNSLFIIELIPCKIFFLPIFCKNLFYRKCISIKDRTCYPGTQIITTKCQVNSYEQRWYFHGDGLISARCNAKRSLGIEGSNIVLGDLDSKSVCIFILEQA